MVCEGEAVLELVMFFYVVRALFLIRLRIVQFNLRFLCGLLISGLCTSCCVYSISYLYVCRLVVTEALVKPFFLIFNFLNVHRDSASHHFFEFTFGLENLFLILICFFLTRDLLINILT